MAKRADIVLEQDSTRVVNDLSLATGPNSDPNVELDVDYSRIEVGGGDVPSGGDAKGRIFVNDDDDDVLASVTATAQGGSVSIYEETGSTGVAGLTTYGSGDGFAFVSGAQDDGGVTLSAANGEGTIEVEASNGATTAKVENLGSGARVSVLDENERRQASIESSRLGGFVTVGNADGARTVELNGEDAALELVGRPEPGPEDDEPRKRFGGGELVLKAWGDPTDTLVHVSGERDSDYGLGRGHRPRIYLDGPDATAEFGRGEQAWGSDPVPGSAVFRDTFGSPLLTVNAESPTHSDDDRHPSEILFRYGAGEDHIPRGAIRSHEEGLMFYDANDQEALLITDNGEIITRESIDEGGL